jgi:threonine dehydratase
VPASPRTPTQSPHPPTPRPQVDFPERPGALRKFLPRLSPRWNVSLFHYRRSGNQSSGVLLGVEVPEADRPEFDAALAALGADYTFTELGGRSKAVFDMFIQ